MKATQYDKLARLLTRKRGATALEIIQGIGTVCPHKRVSEMQRERGWSIHRVQKEGARYGSYFGVPPMQFS